MHGVEERMGRFIGEHHVMTLATVGGSGEAYCANLFYSYMAEENLFVFTSEDKTRHAREMRANNFIAASVVLETKNVGKIQGLQIQGNVSEPEGELYKKARSSYLKRFPYAVVADLQLWILRPTFMKLTDNRLGFGKKLIWSSSDGEE